MPEYFLVGSYQFVPERQEYIAIIIKQEGTTMEVASIGCENSEADALEWIRETIKIMRESGRTDVQAPDMYDRAERLGQMQ